MFPPEIGRPEKPRPPTGAYPSQIFGIIALGPPPKIFWGIFFSGVLGLLDARRGGGAGPSPPLYGPDFLTIPSQNFLESKTEFLRRILINPLSVSAATHHPLRSESDRSAALPRIDAMCEKQTFRQPRAKFAARGASADFGPHGRRARGG
jgi:hypothetical protein